MLSQNNGLVGVSRKEGERVINYTTPYITALNKKGMKSRLIVNRIKITSTMLGAGGRGAEAFVLLGGSSVYIKMNT